MGRRGIELLAELTITITMVTILAIFGSTIFVHICLENLGFKVSLPHKFSFRILLSLIMTIFSTTFAHKSFLILLFLSKHFTVSLSGNFWWMKTKFDDDEIKSLEKNKEKTSKLTENQEARQYL